MNKQLSVREAAECLGVSVPLVCVLCARKKIRHERHGLRGGKILIPADAIDEYRQSVTVTASREVAPPPPNPNPNVKLRHLALD
jgi:excisionase family DNA binding protein